MAIVTVGINPAKNVLAFHGLDDSDRPALVRLEVSSDKLLELIADLSPCLIGMEPARALITGSANSQWPSFPTP